MYSSLRLKFLIGIHCNLLSFGYGGKSAMIFRNEPYTKPLNHIILEKSIHNLELSDFENGKIWIASQYDVENGIDILVTPLTDYDLNKISDKEAWVRINCKTNDGTEFQGLCNLDIRDRNLINYSFYIDGDWVNLLTEPAPEFVLEKDGPIPFAHKIGKRLTDVFPLTLTAKIKPDNVFRKVIEK